MQPTFTKTIDGIKYIWNVSTLIEAAKGLTVIEKPLDAINDLDIVFWFNNNKHQATIRNTVSHMQRVLDADLSIPIILAPDGSLMDGGHRLAKALLQGEKNIKAVQLPNYPQPEVSMEGGVMMMGKQAKPVILKKK